jgi:hypothetical protein
MARQNRLVRGPNVGERVEGARAVLALYVPYAAKEHVQAFLVALERRRVPKGLPFQAYPDTHRGPEQPCLAKLFECLLKTIQD